MARENPVPVSFLTELSYLSVTAEEQERRGAERKRHRDGDRRRGGEDGASKRSHREGSSRRGGDSERSERRGGSYRGWDETPSRFSEAPSTPRLTPAKGGSAEEKF